MDIKTNRRLKKELEDELRQSEEKGDTENVASCRRALTTLRELRKSLLK